MKHFGLIFMVVLIFISRSYSQEVSKENYPAAQKAFFSERQKFCSLYDDQINEIKASQIYSQTNEFSNLFAETNNYGINSWEGTITTISTDKGGEYLDVVIESEIDNYHITFQSTRTLGSGGIEKGTTVYNQIAELTEEQNVTFTGQFKDEGGDLAEFSLTENGSVCDPTFEINLLEVHPSENTKIHSTGGFVGGFIEGFSFVFSIIKYVIIIALIIFVINLFKKFTTNSK